MCSTACELHDSLCYILLDKPISYTGNGCPIRAVTFEPAAKKLLFKADTAHTQVFTARSGPLLQQLQCMLQLQTIPTLLMDHIHNNGLNNALRAPGVLSCSSCSNCFVSNFPLFLGGLAIQQRVCATVSVLTPQEQSSGK